jgi:hypothetical protein
MERNEPRRDHEWDSTRRLIPAAVLVAIGAIFLLRNFHVIHINPFDLWPGILIVMGVSKLVDAPRTGNYTGGAVLVGIGGLLLAGNLGLLPIDSIWQLWPLGLIALGLLLLLERVTWREQITDRWRGRHDSVTSDVPGDLNLTAIFSGGKRRIVTDDFRGGVVDAVFGGYELDLRNSAMKGESATIKVDAVFGGVEMKIPETWSAVVQGSGVFGGFSDETRHPAMTPGTRRLIVEGAAIFGGVVVKN